MSHNIGNGHSYQTIPQAHQVKVLKIPENQDMKSLSAYRTV
jgi:hypothetical protein